LVSIKIQEVSMKGGFLYVITNPAHKGWVKIGVTDDIKDRLHVYQTSDPLRKYKVEYYAFHPDCYTAEKKIKEVMQRFALSIKKEWYEIDLQMAISRVQEQVECID
jgi:hypothetical protein